MNLILIFMMLLTLVRPSFALAEVMIIKQWHLSPKMNTRDVGASRSLPQYKNQKAIYVFLKNRLLSGKGQVLLVEGCSLGKEIDQGFRSVFNGWNVKLLQQMVGRPDYQDILTHVGIKLEAELGKGIRTLCADDEKLVERSQLALSDARALVGFHLRLKQFTGKDPKREKAYSDAYRQVQKGAKGDLVAHSRERALAAIGQFQELSSQRNRIFAQVLKKWASESPMLLVGGLHTKGVLAELEKLGIAAQTQVLEGYPERDEGLIEDLKKALQ